MWAVVGKISTCMLIRIHVYNTHKKTCKEVQSDVPMDDEWPEVVERLDWIAIRIKADRRYLSKYCLKHKEQRFYCIVTITDGQKWMIYVTENCLLFLKAIRDNEKNNILWRMFKDSIYS